MQGWGTARRRSSRARDLFKGLCLRQVAFSFACRMASLAVIAWMALPVAGLAADPKPDATIKNKTVEASVFLGDSVKADPALAADCLAEGRKWIDKQAADAASQRKTDPQMFRDGAWSFER